MTDRVDQFESAFMHEHVPGVTFGRFVRLASVHAADQIALATAYALLFL